MLTERKTRREIIVSMKDKTSESVVRALNGIERKLGALFPQIFLSITCDNGTEFSDAEASKTSAEGKENAPPSTTATHTRRVSAAPTKTKTD